MSNDGKGILYLQKDGAFLCDNVPQSAKYVMRINADGIMFSETGIDGPYRFYTFKNAKIPGITCGNEGVE